MSSIARAPKSRGGCPSSPPASGVSGLPQGFPSTSHRLSLLAPPTRHPSWAPLPTFLPSPCTGLSQRTSLLGLVRTIWGQILFHPLSPEGRGCCRAFRPHSPGLRLLLPLSEECVREAQGQREGEAQRGEGGEGRARPREAPTGLLMDSVLQPDYGEKRRFSEELGR